MGGWVTGGWICLGSRCCGYQEIHVGQRLMGTAIIKLGTFKAEIQSEPVLAMGMVVAITEKVRGVQYTELHVSFAPFSSLFKL
ncbi:unnamed protein product [Linum trigynum]|uniref:Uncharacterized protein n=1 Tax=Linum trigynum TaxID=586398 RepID=A0AAV2CH07_9ROSI